MEVQLPEGIGAKTADDDLKKGLKEKEEERGKSFFSNTLKASGGRVAVWGVVHGKRKKEKRRKKASTGQVQLEKEQEWRNRRRNEEWEEERRTEEKGEERRTGEIGTKKGLKEWEEERRIERREED